MSGRPRVIVTLSFVLLAACASSSPNRVELPSTLPPDLSQDLQERFEIKDSSTLPKPSPSPSSIWGVVEPVVPAVKQKKHRKRVAKGKPGAEPSPTPSASSEPFVYPVRRPAKNPLWVGEEGIYDITYFGMSAGDFTLDILPFKAINNRKVYHIRGTAQTSSVFSLFYRLNDIVETFVDYDGVFSHRFHILLDETKQTRDAVELNDSEKGQTFYWNRWNRKIQGYTETKEFQQIAPFSQDSLSALYYIRSLPLNVGDVYRFPVISEAKSWEAEVTVVRKEILDTIMGRVEAVVVKPETKYQGILQKRGDSFIWLTNDERHIVLRLEAKVKVGTVVARLKKFTPGEQPPPDTSASPTGLPEAPKVQ
jgi:hypothetical protein